MKLDGNTEKYGIELDLLITKFKNKVNQVKNDIKNLGQEAKANVSEIPVDINIKTLSKDIEAAKTQIQMLNEQMREYEKYGYQTSPFYKQLSDDLDIATQKLKTLEQAQASVNAEMEEAETISTKSTVKIGKNFNSLTKKISRYALSLFSLGTIYSLLSRASSAYLSQDIELANKLQSAWVGLGAIMSPLIEKMADLVIRLVGYINVFAQALTGVNYIAQATSKYMNNVANSAKKANNQLASFDELTNLNDSSSLDTATNPFAPFEDLELNPNIVKSLQDLAYWLKENWNWIKLVGEIFLAVFVGAKALKLIGGIGKITGALGKGGLLGSLQSIAAIGAIGITIYIAGNILQDIKQLKQNLADLRKAGSNYWSNWIEEGHTASTVMSELDAKISTAKDTLFKATYPWNILTTYSKQLVKDAETGLSIAQNLLTNIYEQLEAGDLSLEQQENILTKLDGQLEDQQKMKQYLEFIGADTSTINDLMSRTNELGRDIYNNLRAQGLTQDEILEKTGLTKEELNDIRGICEKPVTMELDMDTSKAESKATNFFTKLTNGFKGVVQGALSGTKIPSFDVGTAYVPSDTLAMVHKGERIIPKKYNNEEFLSSLGNNNGETNSLLIQVIDRLDNMNLQPYVTVKDVGQASINYINEQNRYQGRSVIK